MRKVFTTAASIEANVIWFKPEELCSKDNGALFIDADAIQRLDALRGMLRRPLVVVSAYRTPEHNRAVKGAPRSYHLQGRAFDIKVPARAQLEFALQASDLFNGIILYPNHGFVHLDNRDEPFHDLIVNNQRIER